MSNEFPAAESPLAQPVQFGRGVGPARAGLLARLEINTIEDLLFHIPRDVLDLTRIVPVHELNEAKKEVQTVRGIVVDRDSRSISGGRTMTAVLLKCDGGFVKGVWFNQPYMLHKFQPNEIVLFSGLPKFRDKRWEISHPRVQWLDLDEPDATGGVLPRYGLTEGLRMDDMRRMTRAAVEDYSRFVPERLPESLRQRVDVISINEALVGLHQPDSVERFLAARNRVLFEDLLEFQLGIALRRRARSRGKPAIPLPVTTLIDARIRRRFPFRFTKGQDQAVHEVVVDLARVQPMHRLLQADVGAGKTAVALYAMLVAIANQTQTAFMVPTEILAQQHWQTIDRLLEGSQVQRRLLTGQLTAAQRATILGEIANGTAQLVVGTQAIIQDAVAFQRLGLVVIDEQHRFGVMQRSRFTGDQHSPHVLVMTATPIPRSLCLTQFGDLDLSVISESPPGRQRIVTSRVIGPKASDRAWEFIRGKLREGRQLYVVCPRVEDRGDEDSTSAIAMHRILAETELAGFRLGLVHGQMDRGVRNDTMDLFRVGELDALIATTVIEVGVDVANAAMIVIYEAERFGLSQLHQLRGRVGRGNHQGYCFLYSNADAPEISKRLGALEASSDGFAISEADFELRGPGDVLGTRQHGALPLKYADLVRDREILEASRVAAFNLVETAELDEPEFAPLKIQVLDRFGQLMELDRTG